MAPDRVNIYAMKLGDPAPCDSIRPREARCYDPDPGRWDYGHPGDRQEVRLTSLGTEAPQGAPRAELDRRTALRRGRLWRAGGRREGTWSGCPGTPSL